MCWPSKARSKFFQVMKFEFKKQNCPGFSLVEVTLAVAIAALAIMTLLGLLPQGLEMSRKTALLTADSNILEQVARDLDNAKFASLPAQKTKRYFNNDGVEVKQDATDIVYVVEVDPTQQASLPQSEVTQPYLKKFIVRIAVTSNASYEFSATNTFGYTMFNHLVAKTR